MKFYLCNSCNNLVAMVNDSGVSPVCRGEEMTLLVPGTVDASLEKHVPVASVDGDVVKVEVGAVTHPMAEEHYIEWIYLETCCGGQIKYLKPGDSPKASFVLNGQKPVAVYAYCNLHGLWKTEL